MRHGALLTGLAVAALAGGAGCTEVETETATGYEPAKLTEVKGSENKLVTFTQEGADRAGVQVGEVRSTGDGRIVPYRALLYDEEGGTFVYVVQGPLAYLRRRVDVRSIDGDRVLIAAGPSAGSQVVTVGAAEVYGTEKEIAGSH